MPKGPTKDDLVEALAERDAEIIGLTSLVSSERRSGDNWKDIAVKSQQKLRDGRLAVTTILSGVHAAEVHGPFDEDLPKEDGQRVRFLRRLHELLCD